MKRLRVVVALGSSLLAGACQTVAGASRALPPAGPSAAAAASAAPVAGSLRASRVGVSRPAAQTDGVVPTSNFAGVSRSLVIVLAVAAVVVIGVLLMSGDDGEGIY